MRNRQLVAILMISLLLPLSLLTAQNKTAKAVQGSKMEAGKGGMMQGRMNMMPALKLTDDQKQKIQQLRLDMEKEIIKINSQLQLNRVDLKTLFTDKQLNTGKLSGITEENGKLELQIKKLRTDNWIKIYGLLNDDQKEIWKKSFEHRNMAREGLRNRMPGSGQAVGMMQGRMQGRMAQGMMQRQMGQGMMQGRMGQGMMQGQMRPGMPQAADKEKELTTEKK